MVILLWLRFLFSVVITFCFNHSSHCCDWKPCKKKYQGRKSSFIIEVQGKMLPGRDFAVTDFEEVVTLPDYRKHRAVDAHVHLTLLFSFSLWIQCMNGALHIRVNLLLSINFIQKISSQTCSVMCLQGASRLWQVNNISHTQAIYIYMCVCVFVHHDYFVIWKMHTYVFCISLNKISLTSLLVLCMHLSSNLLIKVHLDVTNTFSQNVAYLYNGILDFPCKTEVWNEC